MVSEQLRTTLSPIWKHQSQLVKLNYKSTREAVVLYTGGAS